MEKRFSKSQFMMGLQCPKRLWLYNFRRELLPPPAPASRRRFDEGHAVDELSRGYFKGGRLVAPDYRQLPRALGETARLMRDGVKVLYEAAISGGGVLVRCDALKRNPDGSWDLVEVKSSTAVKQEHFPDAAVQRLALEAAGVRVRKTLLMHVNGAFVRSGPIDPRKFFVAEDITAGVAELLPQVRADLSRFRETLSGPCPEPGIGRHCFTPGECPFRAFCWKDVPEYSVYDVPRLSWEKRSALKALGIIRFRDVPESFDLSEAQRLYLRVEKTGRPAVDKRALAGFLSGLRYPLWHIDFETIMPGIPLYDGTRPYQQVPFQVSLHVQDSPGSEPRHLEHLADPALDPRPGVADFLLRNVGPEGSLLAYNAAFEAARLKELAEAFPARSAGLLALAERAADLMKPFKEQAYVLPEFRGRYSIKVLLPAMVPGMTYEGMVIGNGGDAQLAYMEMATGKTDRARSERIRRDLLDYCGQDTLAMVRILARLYELAG